MTQQEAQGVVERLKRVWTWGGSSGQVTWKLQKHGIQFETRIDPSFDDYIEISIVDVLFWTGTRTGSRRNYGLEARKLSARHGWEIVGMLNYDSVDPEVQVPQDFGGAEHKARQEEFTTRWMPFFRRGCWLSGGGLDASAHEKMEWIQGFSRAELEAWQLNF